MNGAIGPRQTAVSADATLGVEQERQLSQDLHRRPAIQLSAHFLLLWDAGRANSGCRLLTRPAVRQVDWERQERPNCRRQALARHPQTQHVPFSGMDEKWPVAPKPAGGKVTLSRFDLLAQRAARAALKEEYLHK